jgi:hypothetical protein
VIVRLTASEATQRHRLDAATLAVIEREAEYREQCKLALTRTGR